MKILQKDRLIINKNIKIKRDLLLDSLLLFFLFTSPIINCFLFIFNKEASSGQLALAYLLIAILLLGIVLKNYNSKISKSVLITVVTWIVIGILFLTTGIKRNMFNTWYLSEIKAFFAISINIILLLLIIRWKKKLYINDKIIFVLNMLLTVVTFLVVVNSNGLTSGGLISDSSGFLYQNTSYFASYGVGMTIYLICENHLKNELTFSKISFYFIIILFQFIICFTAGGRGGAILAILLAFYGIWKIYGVKGILYSIIPLVIFMLFFPFLLDFISTKLNLDTKGIERALSIFGSGLKDSNRNALWIGAANAFFENPIIGNGVGSIFYLIGSYSHNMFIDLLAETGIIGTIIFILLLIWFVFKLNALCRVSSMYRFLSIIFICGFVMNLFSGYIWVNQQVLLPMVLVLTIKV